MLPNLTAFVQVLAMRRQSGRFRAAARDATATFACLSMVFVCSPFGSQVSAESWLEESGRAEAPDSEKKPDELKWAVTLYGGIITPGQFGRYAKRLGTPPSSSPR